MIGLRKLGDTAGSGDASTNAQSKEGTPSPKPVSSANPESHSKKEDTEEEDVIDEDDGDGWEGIDDGDLIGSPMTTGLQPLKPAAAATNAAGWGWENDWGSTNVVDAMLSGSKGHSSGPQTAQKEEDDLLSSFGFAETKPKPAAATGATRERGLRAAKPQPANGAGSWETWGGKCETDIKFASDFRA
jgi:hypothetical protein